MKTITFSALSCKEVVNCKNGSLLGYVTDLKLDVESYQVLSIFVKSKDSMSFFAKNHILEIPYENIENIGQDIIIVNFLPPVECPEKICKKEKKRLFF